MAFGKQKKKQQNWALKRLKIYHAYKKVDLNKVYYDKEGRPVTGIKLQEELEKKYKWLKK